MSTSAAERFFDDLVRRRLERSHAVSGQRIEERVIDPGNALRRQIQRSFDALGRVQQVVGREP